MLIHIGDNYSINVEDVIGIFDKNILNNKISTDFIKNKKVNNALKKFSNRKTKAFVITKDSVFCSPISVGTIVERVDFVKSIKNYNSLSK